VGLVLKNTGTNILMTSFIIISIFLTAAIVPIPALRAFCLQVAILVLFVLVTTLFGVTSLISFDIRRRRSARIDIFCCFPSEDLKWPFFNNNNSSRTASTIGDQMLQFTSKSDMPSHTSSNLLLVSNFIAVILNSINYNNFLFCLLERI
jgi:hypothetical protein